MLMKLSQTVFQAKVNKTRRLRELQMNPQHFDSSTILQKLRRHCISYKTRARKGRASIHESVTPRKIDHPGVMN